MHGKIIAGTVLGSLFIAFGLVSLLVLLTKRHPYFVGKKLRLGALILSLSGVSAGCIVTPTCYSPAPPPNEFQIDQPNSYNDSIIINKAVSDTITGKIFQRKGDAFSFAIFDPADFMVLKDNILPVDGTFDENIEEFKIGLGQAIQPGYYFLKFYTVSKDSITNNDRYGRSFSLIVKE